MSIKFRKWFADALDLYRDAGNTGVEQLVLYLGPQESQSPC